MKDPLRIPHVLDALTRAWESQPDLTLPQLYGVLESRGIGWNSTDGEVMDVLSALTAERPSLLTADAPGRYLVETEQPSYRVTVDPWWAAVRPARRGPASGSGSASGSDTPQPTVWRHGGIRRCAVSQPLTVLSAEGIVHRFGLVSRITVLAATVDSIADAPDLSGLHRAELDGHAYLLRLAGDDHAGTTVLVDHALWVFDVTRREVRRDKVSWSRLVSASVGSELVIDRSDGGTMRLPVVEQVTVLE
ncbi:hypothetical protein [Corynebacterium sp.]|uniref:hypothetical protein n=1 Tax=Corynebacterium sp. TaxID=1720 RepID=UPI003B3B7A78